jgi:hypothetical protein
MHCGSRDNSLWTYYICMHCGPRDNKLWTCAVALLYIMGFLLYMNTLWTNRQFIVDLLYMYVLWTKRQLIVDLHSWFTIYYGISIVHECIVDQETIHCGLTIHVCTVDQKTISCGLAQLLYYILKRTEKHCRNTVYLLWTQTHCHVDDTVTIEYLHCERHCSTLGAFLSYVFS